MFVYSCTAVTVTSTTTIHAVLVPCVIGDVFHAVSAQLWWKYICGCYRFDSAFVKSSGIVTDPEYRSQLHMMHGGNDILLLISDSGKALYIILEN